MHMDKNYDNQIPDEIQLLIAERASGKLSADGRVMLEKWLISNPDLSGEVQRLETLLEVLIMQNRRQKINTAIAYKKVVAQHKKRQQFHLMKWLPYAASVLILIGLTWYFLMPDQKSQIDQSPLVQQESGKRQEKAMLVLSDGSRLMLDADSTISLQEQNGISIENHSGGKLRYETSASEATAHLMHQLIIPAGARYQLQLSDGTQVWLNAASTLEYPLAFGDTKRVVKLVGEAFFDVQPDSRPFQIEVNGNVVTVHGTSFNISSYPEDGITATTLVSGSVSFTGSKGETKQLLPGEQLRIHHQNNTMEIEKVDTKLYVSWKEGVLHFKKISLAELSRKLSRWYDVEIVFEDPSKAAILFSGALENSRELDFLLHLITKTAPVTYERKGKKIIIK